MIEKIIKLFFKKETKKACKNTQISLEKRGELYVANVETKTDPASTELSKYFNGFVGLKEVAKIRNYDLA